MTPNLPGALIEREKVCDICGTTCTAWVNVELTKGGSAYSLCPDCEADCAEIIADVRAYRDAGQQAEDESQEGE